MKNGRCFLIVITILFSIQGAVFAQYQPGAYPGNNPVSFVRTWSATAPIQDTGIFIGRPFNEVKQTTSYVDGLGRPLQTVIRQGSMATGGNPTDMVVPVEYDDCGREIYKWKPYASAESNGLFKTDPFDRQGEFVQAQFGGQGDSHFYDKITYEASPLNRPLAIYGPGKNWVGANRGIETKYWTNSTTDGVRIWHVTDVPGSFATYSTPAIDGIYSATMLYKTVTVNEQGVQVIEFKDKEGQVILKKVQLMASADNGSGSGHTGWLCTYYIYDDLKQLRAVIQPEGVKLLEQYAWDVNALSGNILTEQCFRYEYDNRNRMTRKKVPGAGEVWMVYDMRDRLVMTQDRNQNEALKWMYTKYDALNRPISSGIITDVTNYNNLAYHQGLAATSSDYPALANYPGTLTEELTKTYYDNYTWLSSVSPAIQPSATFNTNHNSYLSAASTSFPYAETPSKSNATVGLVTGTSLKVLGTSDTYLYKVNLYDDKGRLIQVQSNNITSPTTTLDIVTTQYNFSGQPLVMVHRQDKQGANAQEHTVITKLNYDALDRLSTVWKSVTSFVGGQAVVKPEQLILSNEYDALGQLKKKTLGAADLESVEYEYNIRGWLSSINKSYLNNTVSHAFGMELGYDRAGSAAGSSFAQPQYNGNIAGVVWKSKGDGTERQYDFTYDLASRLTSAPFRQHNHGAGWDATQMDFGVSGLDYDANGNIKRMKQMGIKAGVAAPQLIDDLTYTYRNDNISNQLLNVIDAVNDPGTKLGDFRSSSQYMAALSGTKTDQAIDYSYDANGNLLKDMNKDFGSVSDPSFHYNHLNLVDGVTLKGPGNVDKGHIVFQYDAGGTKLSKIISETGQPDKVMLYLNGFVYENDVLQFAGHEEGRIRFTPAAGNALAKFDYDYFIKDHLGNVRMVLTEEQEQAIYPAATLEGDINTDGSPNAIFTEKNYYQIDPSNVVDKPLGIPDYANNNGNPPENNNPNSQVTAISQKMYRLQANAATSGKAAMGLGITLKVMSGDRIDVFGKSYYQVDNSSSTNYTLPTVDMLSGLLGGAAGVGAAKGVSASTLNGLPGVTGGIDLFINNPGRGGGSTPKAYVNYVLLDEQFQYVSGGFSRVGDINTIKEHFADLQNIAVTKNGYLYVYCSNESPVQVFFDNVQVIHTKGALVEETHYYPFGLTMAGISSRAAGKIENRFKHNGKELQSEEFSEGSGLELYDFDARMLDPQLGRWCGQDAHAESYFSWSPYHYAGNNPVLMTDPDGMDWHITTSKREDGTILYNVTVNGVLYNNSSNATLDMSALQKQIEKQIGEVFNFSGDGFSVTTNFNFKTVTSIDDIKETDHVFQVVDEGVAAGSADGEINGLNVRIGVKMAEQTISGENTRTIAHELGHTGGWEHNAAGKVIVPNVVLTKEQVSNNLMTQTSYASFLKKNDQSKSSKEILGTQMQHLSNAANADLLNKNSPLRIERVPNGMEIIPGQRPKALIKTIKTLRQ